MSHSVVWLYLVDVPIIFGPSGLSILTEMFWTLLNLGCGDHTPVAFVDELQWAHCFLQLGTGLCHVAQLWTLPFTTTIKRMNNWGSAHLSYIGMSPCENWTFVCKYFASSSAYWLVVYWSTLIYQHFMKNILSAWGICFLYSGKEAAFKEWMLVFFQTEVQWFSFMSQQYLQAFRICTVMPKLKYLFLYHCHYWKQTNLFWWVLITRIQTFHV